jgi:hypothetical protein
MLAFVKVTGEAELILFPAGISATCVTNIWSLTWSSISLASASANLVATLEVNSKFEAAISCLVRVILKGEYLSITKFSKVIVKSLLVIACPGQVPNTQVATVPAQVTDCAVKFKVGKV